MSRLQEWVDKGMVAPEDVERAKAFKEKKGSKLSVEDILLKSNKVQGAKVQEEEQGKEQVLTTREVDTGLLALLSDKKAVAEEIMPLRKKDNVLTLAVHERKDYQVLDSIKKLYGVKKVEPVYVSKSSLKNVLEELTSVSPFESSEEVDDLPEDDMDDDSPIVKYVNDLFYKAIEMGVSDIHVEPRLRQPSRIRFRIDGELVEHAEIPAKMHAQVVSRVKILANLDISKRYEPQDGEIQYRFDNDYINLRVNILPLTSSEKIVARVLGKADSLIPLEDIGLTEKNYQIIEKNIKKKQGLLLVTGPTGSGKTTTMYAALQRINTLNKNLSTVEDPVELNVPGLNQVQVSQRISFADTLRALLRQDPDVIMIGEIRDKETAEISVRSSLTGHVVLSTLHTNNALSTVARLMDMKIEPYLLADALNVVVSQRLVRRICSHCKVEDLEAMEYLRSDIAHYLDEVEEKTVYKGTGCDQCGGRGYQGRVSIHEVLEINDDLRSLMINGKVNEIRSFGNKSLMVEDALVKMFEGLIDMREVQGILLDF